MSQESGKSFTTPYSPPSQGAIAIAHKDGFDDSSFRWRKFVEKTLVDLAGGQRGIASATADGAVLREPQKTLVEALAKILSFDPRLPISEVDPYDCYTLADMLRRAALESPEDYIRLPRQTTHYMLAYLSAMQRSISFAEELFSFIGPLTKSNSSISSDETLSRLALLRETIARLSEAYRAG